MEEGGKGDEGRRVKEERWVEEGGKGDERRRVEKGMRGGGWKRGRADKGGRVEGVIITKGKVGRCGI